MKVLLDTNFLLAPIKLGTDIYEQLAGKQLTTLSCCLDELDKLGPDGSAAKKLAQKKQLEIIDAKGSCDNQLLKIAKENDWSVATNDKELIKTLKNNDVKTLRLRQKKFVIEG